MKDRKLAAILCFVLGGFGVHRFYVGKNTTAVIMAALTVLGLVTSAAGFGWIALLGVFGWCTKRWQLSVPVVCR